MKNLKLIVLMLLVANLATAQTRYGSGAGTSGGANSCYFGNNAGSQATGWVNTFVGANAGFYSSGNGNLAFGNAALMNNASGLSNISIGNNAGRHSQGNFNTNIGDSSGKEVENNGQAGNGNTNFGYQAGFYGEGNNNVFIGFKSGFNDVMNYSNKLYIDSHYDKIPNAESAPWTTIRDFKPDLNQINTPLIYGDFATDQVGIGTNDVGNYTLAVKGHVVAEEITVKAYTAGWADYVFAEDYDLMPLAELETEIEKLGHLPEVPSAEEVLENGHKVGEMDVILLKKVEEMTLHLIDMNKAIQALQESEKELRKENAALKNKLNK